MPSTVQFCLQTVTHFRELIRVDRDGGVSGHGVLVLPIVWVRPQAAGDHGPPAARGASASGLRVRVVPPSRPRLQVRTPPPGWPKMSCSFLVAVLVWHFNKSTNPTLASAG